VKKEKKIYHSDQQSIYRHTIRLENSINI